MKLYDGGGWRASLGWRGTVGRMGPRTRGWPEKRTLKYSCPSSLDRRLSGMVGLALINIRITDG